MALFSLLDDQSEIMNCLEYPVDQDRSIFCTITKFSGEIIRCLHCFLMSG